MMLTWLIAGSNLKIFTISGKPVSNLDETGAGEISWDGNNLSGNSIVNGVYVYVLSDAAGNKKSGKIVVTP